MTWDFIDPNFLRELEKGLLQAAYNDPLGTAYALRYPLGGLAVAAAATAYCTKDCWMPHYQEARKSPKDYVQSIPSRIKEKFGYGKTKKE